MPRDVDPIASTPLPGDLDKAMSYDGRSITVGSIVRRLTGGVALKVRYITDDDGRALLHLVALDGTLSATIHAGFAILAPNDATPEGEPR